MKKEDFALISSKSSKNKLKNIGIDPRQLIVTGGPLHFEDYKIINPNLTDKALKNIKSQCERIYAQIKSEDWSKKNLIFIYEKENPTDKSILNRLDELVNIIGKKIKTYKLNNWKELNS